MIALLSLALAVQAAPIQWDALPPLPYRTPPVVTDEMSAFVKRETAARNCPLPPPIDESQTLRIDVAVLVDQGGNIRTTVPRAIQCASVEQYAAAMVAGFARNNLLPRMVAEEQWYRATFSFTWTR